MPMSVRPNLPPTAPGLRVGLYGGSFNPAHAGHLHVSRMALRRLRLDRVWWLVSPGNPLKDQGDLEPVQRRLDCATRIAKDPRLVVTDLESRIGSHYTIDTLDWLLSRRRVVRFVWIMGADSLSNFHFWKAYRRIAALMPIAVIDRPGSTLRAPLAKGAAALARYRIDETDAALLADLDPPAWVYLHGPRSSLSSTDLRKHG